MTRSETYQGARGVSPSYLERVPVLGSLISDCDCESGLRILDPATRGSRGGYVCFTNVHTAVLGHEDLAMRSITNQSLLSMADGKPIYWVARARGAKRVDHCPGPDFFIEVLKRYPQAGHFFYGSSPEVLNRLTRNLVDLVPGVVVSGSMSPPFRELSEAERMSHYEVIRQSGAAFVWVGLGAPKQERWMSDAWKELGPCVALGVGAAFDFLAGEVRRAPATMGRMGLEWLYRLAQEPRRLWRRYLVTNTKFVLLVTAEYGRRILRFRDN